MSPHRGSLEPASRTRKVNRVGAAYGLCPRCSTSQCRTLLPWATGPSCFLTMLQTRPSCAGRHCCSCAPLPRPCSPHPRLRTLHCPPPLLAGLLHTQALSWPLPRASEHLQQLSDQRTMPSHLTRSPASAWSVLPSSHARGPTHPCSRPWLASILSPGRGFSSFLGLMCLGEASASPWFLSLEVPCHPGHPRWGVGTGVHSVFPPGCPCVHVSIRRTGRRKGLAKAV